ncbi:MAG TPA: DUF5060 domain-containing protein, partial [Bryobacteraceae bacterium]
MFSRREFIQSSTAGLVWLPQVARAQNRFGVQHCPAEWSYRSAKQYADPFNEIGLDVVFRSSAGMEFRVPAFWAGGATWRVRFAPPAEGSYT